MGELPLLERFPALARLPRAALGSFPTPVQRVAMSGAGLWIKRDDRSGQRIGGNKVRGLEWLLGGLETRDRVLTVGPKGSTHALATTRYARVLGAATTVARWNQTMNPAAVCVDALLRQEARVIDARAVPLAYAVATALRVRPRTRWIPAGGASPVAVLGHVNAALELAEQIERGECAPPASVVVPFGTGGTAAGLALGFRIAGVATRVIAVRVVPTLLGRAGRLLALAGRAAVLIERITGERVPRLRETDVLVEHRFYAGGYGRALVEHEGTRSFESLGIVLDDTYSRKAAAAALTLAPIQETLLWLTFDGRLLNEATGTG